MIIYRHNTGKQINQLAFRVNLVEHFDQFPNGECKVSGCWAEENIIPQLKVSHFMHKVPPSAKNQHHRGGVWYAPNMARRKIQCFAVYSVMSDYVLRNDLKPTTQNLISKIIVLIH
jgi:hypothetical protein